eukprot:11175034-Lingulodinium_polyedra.AAC.1
MLFARSRRAVPVLTQNHACDGVANARRNTPHAMGAEPADTPKRKLGPKSRRRRLRVRTR